MKKFILLIFILLSLFVVACGKNDKNMITEEYDNSKLQVYTSFYALYDFVDKIGGDKIQLYNMVPTGIEPHDWEPTAGNMLNLEKGDILFYNGMGMENWIEKVMTSIENKNILFIELSETIEKDNSNLDPHIWLDPKNVIKEIEVIKDTLSEKDTANKEYYENNFNLFKNQLEKLDNDFKNQLSGFKNNNIVVSHEAYGYMCKAYNLNQISIEGSSGNSEPSPAKMASVSEFIKNNNIKYIFTDQLINQKIAETIAEETNSEILLLSPFEGLTDEQIENKEDYISIMYRNLENIKKALGE